MEIFLKWNKKKFLFNSLQEQIERFKAFKAGHGEGKDVEKTSAEPKPAKKETPATKSTPKSNVKTVTPSVEEEDDNVPF